MKKLSHLRLVSLSTVIVASVLLILTFIFASIFVRNYAVTLDFDEQKLLQQIHRRITDKNRPISIQSGLAAVAHVPFRRALGVILLQSDLRGSIYYPDDGGKALNPVVTLRHRSEQQAIPPAQTLRDRVLSNITAIFTDQPPREYIGTLEIYIRPNPVQISRELSPWLSVLFFVCILVGLMASLSGRVLNRQALRPLNDVTIALERLAGGDFTPQFISSSNTTPLRRLATAFNGAVTQVEEAFAEREQANIAMRQFISDAGHQLRTPLTVIRGFITVLSENPAGPADERERYLNVLRQQCLLMGTLIDNLILLDRWERQLDQKTLMPVDISQLMADIVHMHVDAHPARRFILNEGAAAGSLALIEPHELHHAISNLFDNALKYTQGALHIDLRVADAQLFITIADDGPGMDAIFAAHAFDRFSRGERRDIEGSGLGLSITKRAVERSGGTITFSSDPQSGTIFKITLPIARDVT